MLPIVTSPLVRRVLASETNLVTMAALVAYALAAWVLAFGLSGFAIAGWGMGALLLVAFVAAFVYDYFIFSLIDERR